MVIGIPVGNGTAESPVSEGKEVGVTVGGVKEKIKDAVDKRSKEEEKKPQGDFFPSFW